MNIVRMGIGDAVFDANGAMTGILVVGGASTTALDTAEIYGNRSRLPIQSRVTPREQSRGAFLAVSDAGKVAVERTDRREDFRATPGWAGTYRHGVALQAIVASLNFSGFR